MELSYADLLGNLASYATESFILTQWMWCKCVCVDVVILRNLHVWL